jgi:hypothetical protein
MNNERESNTHTPLPGFYYLKGIAQELSNDNFAFIITCISFILPVKTTPTLLPF